MKCQQCGGTVLKDDNTLKCLNCRREHRANGELKIGLTCKYGMRNCARCPYLKESLCDYPYIGSRIVRRFHYAR